jgi:hypothetical protein
MSPPLILMLRDLARDRLQKLCAGVAGLSCKAFRHATVDFEAEAAVDCDDVAMRATPAEAARGIRLLMLVNDVSLRKLIPAELAKGFGILQSNPSSAFSPVAIAPDEAGGAWDGGRLHGALRVDFNGNAFGCADAGRAAGAGWRLPHPWRPRAGVVTWQPPARTICKRWSSRSPHVWARRWNAVASSSVTSRAPD